MKTKNKKLLAIGTGVMAVALGVGVFASLGHGGLLLRSKATDIVAGSVSYTWESVYSSVSSSKKTFVASTQRGEQIFMYSQGAGTIASQGRPYVASFNSSSYANSSIEFFADASRTESYIFQNVTSINIAVANSSDSGMKLRVYTDELEVFYNDYDCVEGATLTVSDISGASYLKLAPANSGWLEISSITLNYSCESGRSSAKYSLSYDGFDVDEYEIVPLRGVDTSKLPTECTVGRRIKIKAVLLEDFAFDGFMFNDPDEELPMEEMDPEYDLENKIVSFNMPACPVTVVIATHFDGVLELQSINVTDPKTSFSLNDDFSIGEGTVTAYFNDGSSQDVTASASFTGYDKTQIGQQTITVSYTYNSVVKSTSYNIEVSGFSPLYLSGTYVCSATSKITIEFLNNSEAVISFDKSNAYQTTIRTCSVTYSANALNKNMTLTFSSINFQYLSNWGYIYIPFSNGFRDGNPNDTCVISSDNNSFTMMVYEYISSTKTYEEYNTYSFTKQAA